jgi:hypothetical protein
LRNEPGTNSSLRHSNMCAPIIMKSTNNVSRHTTGSRGRTLLSESEQRVLRAFRRFLINPGQMLCFFGPDLKKHQAALRLLTEKELLVKEQFKGGYSLTRAGFVAMRDCE